eukprot:TRINITY_DN7865_c0_g1_i1.p1 TRINITY_DN7865_c0_g1~~TRINITY_DN7865_c0_g1_i1.p1  ORF type:complete len:161 (-),score=3.02 TRINITY_DN7865_c0_g1_i1:34-516(-)
MSESVMEVLCQSPILFPHLEDIRVDPADHSPHPHDPGRLLEWFEFRQRSGAAPLIALDASLTLETLIRLYSIWGPNIRYLTLRNGVNNVTHDWFPHVVKFENLESLTIPSLAHRGHLRIHIPKLKHLCYFDISFPSGPQYLLPSIASAIKSMPSMATFKY